MSLALLLLLQDEWPGFRGPTGQGIATAATLPLKGDRNSVLWAADLVGEGHASPIVGRDRIFVCTVRWPGGKPDKSVMPEHHVVAYVVGR